MKLKRPEWHCKGCVWLTRDNLCPFIRCVRWHGFKAEWEAKKDEQEAQKEH
jgi:hypothetical protein